MDIAAGKTPQQKTVDGAEGEMALVRQAPRPVHVVEDPCHLGRREIRVETQAGFAGDHIICAALAEFAAISCRSPILPDNRVIDAFAAASIPDDRRLALVGDTDSGDILNRDAGLDERLSGYLPDR